jgi:hypothetical protein
MPGLSAAQGATTMLITRADGLIDAAQAALMCDVGESTIRAWVSRSMLAKAGIDERGRSLFRPEDVARTEHSTRKRARRRPRPVLALAMAADDPG